jgi:hypothetical protein
VLRTDSADISRYEPDETMSTVAAWRREGDNLLTRTHYPIEPQSMSDLVLRTSQPIRIDSFADAHGTIADMIREFGIRSAVGCPIMEGRLWGHMSAGLPRAGPAHVPGGRADRAARTRGATGPGQRRAGGGGGRTAGALAGIHPAILSEGGLGPALKVLARRPGIGRDHHRPQSCRPGHQTADQARIRSRGRLRVRTRWPRACRGCSSPGLAYR